MISQLKDLTEDYDIIRFLPTENEDQLYVDVLRYKEQANCIGGSPLGKEYHILLFRFDEEENTKDLDLFDAILIDPRVYVSHILYDGWYGAVGKKTENSRKIFDDMMDDLKTIDNKN
jgi:hypothetical protein